MFIHQKVLEKKTVERRILTRIRYLYSEVGIFWDI